jgi:hypothetical protein
MLGNVLLLGPNGVNAICKFLGLGEIRQFRLHPYHVAVRRVGNGAVDGALAAALVPVVALACPRSFPVEVHIDASQAVRNSTGFCVALALALLQELANELFLIHVNAGVDCVDDGLVEELQVCLLCPRVLDGLQLCTVLSSLLGHVHELAERLQCGVGATHDVVVVPRVDGRRDEGSGFGISTGDRKKISAYFLSAMRLL